MALGHCWECGYVYRDRETCPSCGHGLTPLRTVLISAGVVFLVAVVCVGLMIYLSP